MGCPLQVGCSTQPSRGAGSSSLPMRLASWSGCFWCSALTALPAARSAAANYLSACFVFATALSLSFKVRLTPLSIRSAGARQSADPAAADRLILQPTALGWVLGCWGMSYVDHGLRSRPSVRRLQSRHISDWAASLLSPSGEAMYASCTTAGASPGVALAVLLLPFGWVHNPLPAATYGTAA